MDCKPRKLPTVLRFHHPKADTERLYLPRRRGGHGLIKLNTAYKTSSGFCNYIKQDNNHCTRMTADHKKAKAMFYMLKMGEEVEKKHSRVRTANPRQ